MSFSPEITISAALSIGGYVIAGILFVLGLFNKQAASRRVADDTISTNLITNLQTTCNLQEKEITTLREKEVEQGKEIAHLQGQVKTLSDLMQGRDPAMQSFLGGAPELMRIAAENNKLALATSQSVKDLTGAVHALVGLLTPKSA